MDQHCRSSRPASDWDPGSTVLPDSEPDRRADYAAIGHVGLVVVCGVKEGKQQKNKEK